MYDEKKGKGRKKIFGDRKFSRLLLRCSKNPQYPVYFGKRNGRCKHFNNKQACTGLGMCLARLSQRCPSSICMKLKASWRCAAIASRYNGNRGLKFSATDRVSSCVNKPRPAYTFSPLRIDGSRAFFFRSATHRRRNIGDSANPPRFQSLSSLRVIPDFSLLSIFVSSPCIQIFIYIPMILFIFKQITNSFSLVYFLH